MNTLKILKIGLYVLGSLSFGLLCYSLYIENYITAIINILGLIFCVIGLKGAKI